MGNFNFWTLLIPLGTVQGINLFFRLFFSSRKVLAFLVLIVSLEMLDTFFILTDLYYHFPHLINIADPFYVLIGPLLFFIIRGLTGKRLHFKASYLLFFLPVLVQIVFYLPFYISSAEEKKLIYTGYQTDSETNLIYLLFWIIEIIYNLCFILPSFFELQRHEESIKKEYSDIQGFSLEWLRHFVIFFIFYFCLQAALAAGLALSDVSVKLASFSYLILSVSIFVLGYRGMNQASVPESALMEPEQVKYRKSSLDSDRSDSIITRLYALMDDEKPWLEQSLKLGDLAGRLSLSPNHLSQAINEKAGYNFYDFINSYRIKEACRILSDRSLDHLTVIAVAMDAGFSSKSAFNKVFKEQTGLTPSGFRKNS